MGSTAIAAWIAHVVFWTLLVVGLIIGELGAKRAAVFLALWLGAFTGLRYLPAGAPPFSSVVAVLDIVLVFLVLKGDVRLT